MALAVTWDGALFFTSKASSIGIANAVAVSTLMPVALIDKRAGNSNVLVDKALRRIVREINAINAPPTAPAAAPPPTAAAVPAAPAAPAAASGSGGASSAAGSARASTTTVRGKKMLHEKQ